MDRKCYTLGEVTGHDGRADPRTWIVVRGLVYDVTDFMLEHPGGAELIVEYAGKDATSAFEDVGHSSDAKRILKKYEIGFLAGMRDGNKKDQEVKSNSADADRISMKKSHDKPRRKILSMFLGPCASA